MTARCLSKPYCRLWRSRDGTWRGYSRKMYGYIFPEMGLEIVTSNKKEARKWWRRKPN